jgi:predicted RNA-binding protein YlqC (UPF0109 family)
MSDSSLRELVEYMARSLVDSPEEVVVNEVGGEQAVVFELHVSAADRGKVIGRNGRMARAMRTLLSTAAGIQGKRATLEILD